MMVVNEINSKEQSVSWKDDSSLGSQEIARILWNPEADYPVQNRLVTGPYSEQNKLSPHKHIAFL
jgi:hypothetical protein